MSSQTPPTTFRTGIGASEADSIMLLGHDLATELLGKISFGELAYWLLTNRRPSEGQRAMFEAVLVALADHGFTPTAIATRVTLLGAPESVQGALAAGLLGGGSRFLGVTEDAAGFLDSVISSLDALPVDDTGWDAVALEAVAAQRAGGRFVPGLGHPVHKQGDPRTPALCALAREHGEYGPHLGCSRRSDESTPACSDAACRSTARACAEPCSPTSQYRWELSAEWRCWRVRRPARPHRGRATRPIAMDIYTTVDRNTDYRPL